MQISTFVLYGLVEAMVLLVVLCTFLLIFIGRNKAKIRGLQGTIRTLVARHKKLEAQVAQERLEHSTSNTYKKQINDQLLLTREYHQGLEAGQDIALDLNPEIPANRQTAAIRHALLVAEKEALNSSTDGAPNWQFLETKFQQLIQFYVDLSRKKAKASAAAAPKSADHSELLKQVQDAETALTEKVKTLEALRTEFETTRKRVANLEKFKTLFFDMEKKWEEAKTEAELYYQRLQGLRDQVDNSEGYDNLIKDYHNVYSEFELTLHDFSEDEVSQPEQAEVKEFDLTPKSAAIEIMSSEKQALEELKKLRNLTADQHRLITKLQQQLDDAKTIEEKEAVIGDLQRELKKQIGFVQESEACIQLLENELTNAMSRLKNLETGLTEAESELQHIPKMKTTIQQFAQESKEMLLNLTELERKNEELRDGQATTGVNDNNIALVEKMQSQLQSLQSQYAELEERYLEAKMSG